MTDEEFRILTDQSKPLKERIDLLIEHDPRSVFAKLMKEILELVK